MFGVCSLGCADEIPALIIPRKLLLIRERVKTFAAHPENIFRDIR